MMKKISLVLLCLFLSFGLASAGGLLSSGEKTSDTVIHANNSYLGGVLIITDESNDASLIVYDNATAASGTKVWETVITGSANFGGGLFPHWIYCNNGIYADVSGTGASFIIYYIDAHQDGRYPIGP